MVISCAWLLTLVGGSLIYLSHAQQGWLTQPLQGFFGWLGAIVAAAGAIAWVIACGIGAGVAGAVTSLMAIWSVLPYLAWLQRAARKSAQSPVSHKRP